MSERYVNGQAGDGIEFCIDARSVFDSISADVVKTTADKTMLIHALKVREYLDRHLISRMWWIDTEDMVTDGLTKGKVRRDDILSLMLTGKWHVRKATRSWPSLAK